MKGKAAALARRDDAGDTWTLAQVLHQVVAVVCALDDNLSPSEVTHSSSFAKDFGWDEPFRMRLRKPVALQLHEKISAFEIEEQVRTVGDLVDLVWSKMSPS
jgi:acyl carrier protein